MREIFKTKLAGHLMVFTTIIIYSFNTNFMKTIMPDWIGPYGLTLMRCAIALIAFYIITLFIPSAERKVITKKDIQAFIIGGAIGFAGNMLFYIVGLEKTGPVDVFVLRSSQPIIVLILSIFFMHKKLTWNKTIGLLLGMAGVIFITMHQPHGNAKSAYIGDIFILIASFLYAAYLILIKPHTANINPFVAMKWMFLSATIVSFPFGIDELIKAPLWTRPFDIKVVSELAFIMLISTMVCNVLTLEALKRISSFTTSVYIYLLPITGTIIAVWFGLQTITWHTVGAFVLILGGFIFVNINKKSKKAEQHFPTFMH